MDLHNIYKLVIIIYCEIGKTNYFFKKWQEDIYSRRFVIDKGRYRQLYDIQKLNIIYENYN